MKDIPEQAIGINLITRTTKSSDIVGFGSRKLRLAVSILSLATVALAAFFGIGFLILTSRVTSLKYQHAQSLNTEASYAQVATLLSLVKYRIKIIHDLNAARMTWSRLLPTISSAGSPAIRSVSASENRNISFQLKAQSLDEARIIIDDFKVALLAIGARSVVLESLLMAPDGSVIFSVSFRL